MVSTVKDSHSESTPYLGEESSLLQFKRTVQDISPTAIFPFAARIRNLQATQHFVFSSI